MSPYYVQPAELFSPTEFDRIQDRIQFLYLNSQLHEIMQSVSRAEMMAAALSVIESYRLTEDETDLLVRIAKHKDENRDRVGIGLKEREERSYNDCDSQKEIDAERNREALVRDWLAKGPVA